MSTKTGRVSAAEISELLAFQRRLRHRGGEATCAEWVAYFEAKADIFARLADDPWMQDSRAASLAASAKARGEADRLRAEAADWRWL